MAETDPFVSSPEIYSIVVAGAMNPAIHHPAWYKSIGALKDEEASLALPSSPLQIAEQWLATICTPQVAQFTVGRIRVVCIQQSWTIVTTDSDLVVRILGIASCVFRALGHTPVSAYGLNVASHRSSGVQRVGARLAELVQRLPLGLVFSGETSNSATIALKSSVENRDLNITIQPSVKAEDMIFAAINVNHRIVQAKDFQSFDLEPLLVDSVNKDYPEALNLISKIVAAFASSERPA